MTRETKLLQSQIDQLEGFIDWLLGLMPSELYNSEDVGGRWQGVRDKNYKAWKELDGSPCGVEEAGDASSD